MRKDFLESQKNKLEDERNRINSELASIGVKTSAGFKPKVSDYGDSSDDTARETEQYETSLANEKTLLELRAKVENALLAVKSGNYGTCEVGGKRHEIAEKRLIAFPEATTCIEHAQEAE